MAAAVALEQHHVQHTALCESEREAHPGITAADDRDARFGLALQGRQPGEGTGACGVPGRWHHRASIPAKSKPGSGCTFASQCFSVHQPLMRKCTLTPYWVADAISATRCRSSGSAAAKWRVARTIPALLPQSNRLPSKRCASTGISFSSWAIASVNWISPPAPGVVDSSKSKMRPGNT